MFNFLKFSLFVSCFLLASCDDVTSQGDVTFLSDLNISDEGLKYCIDEQVSKEGWTTLAEVTELTCPCVNKTRAFELNVCIKDISDISIFKSLQQLNLSGHFYTEIDVSALTALEGLNLAGSFIQSIDLSKNTHLKMLNLSSTAIPTLNLVGLKNLKELNITMGGSGIDPVYQEISLQTAASEGYNIPVTFNMIVNTETNLTLDSEALLEVVYVRDNRMVESLKFNNVVKASGYFSAHLFEYAEGLTSFYGRISGGELLDLSKFSKLKKFIFNSDTVTEIKIHQNMVELKTIAPISTFDFPLDSKLEVVDVRSVNADRLLYLDFPLMDTWAGNLRTLTIAGYSFDRAMNLSNSNQLSDLRFYNSLVAVVTVPESLTRVHIANSYGTSIEAGENIESLYLGYQLNYSCEYDGTEFPHLTSLVLLDCDSETIDFSSTPLLASLYIEGGLLTEVDFSNNSNLIDISLSTTNISKVVLPPLSGAQQGRFYSRDNPFNEDVDSLFHEMVKSMFSDVTI